MIEIVVAVMGTLCSKVNEDVIDGICSVLFEGIFITIFGGEVKEKCEEPLKPILTKNVVLFFYFRENECQFYCRYSLIVGHLY